MKRHRTAPDRQKRAGGHPGASPKITPGNDHQRGAAKPRRDKLSIEQFSRLLGGGIPLTTLRRTLLGAGLDLADGISPLEAVPLITGRLLEQLAHSGLDIRRDKARALAAAADTAEIQLGKLLASLVSRGAVRCVMENAVATYNGEIHGMAGLTADQRKVVCALLRETFSPTLGT